jgi:hypothetical protein
MTPFMVATGQYPHVPLGVQLKSSSLAHPETPGVNDLYLRPLWKIWGTFNDARNIEFYNDFNSHGILKSDNQEKTGCYLMLDRKNMAALLVLSNFAERKRTVKVKINWTKIDFIPPNVVMLMPDENSPGQAVLYADKDNFIIDIPPHGCAGFLLGAEKSITNFEAPYAPLPVEAEEYKREVEKQLKLRCAPEEEQEKLFFKVEIPEYSIPCCCCHGYYDVEHEIGTIDENNNFIMLGYVTKSGFTRNKPLPDQCIWAGEFSPWIDMHKILPEGGRKCVAIKTRRTLHGDYFHSFIEVLISPNADKSNSHRLIFYNEVEPERETLHFKINLANKENHEKKHH